MKRFVIFVALLAALLLEETSVVKASNNYVASVSASEWNDVWRSAMSLYNSSDGYHRKSMISTLSHSARRMQENNEERMLSLVCGNRHDVSVSNLCAINTSSLNGSCYCLLLTGTLDIISSRTR